MAETSEDESTKGTERILIPEAEETKSTERILIPEPKQEAEAKEGRNEFWIQHSGVPGFVTPRCVQRSVRPTEPANGRHYMSKSTILAVRLSIGVGSFLATALNRASAGQPPMAEPVGQQGQMWR